MARRRVIGCFKIEHEVASGASGTVYQALDTTTGERVAVKLIRGLGEVDAARFAREARILAAVRHPGVVRYIDHGHTDDGDAYLAMEWLEGEDLRERLARAGLSMNESVALGLRVAGALAAVHARGLVHRDIKPANLFLVAQRAEDAKVIDFGLARGDEAATVLTQTGRVVGTPAYMAPEQARGQRELDGRADVFSLGCVLFKCLAGRPPFEGNSVMAVLTKILLEEPPRLSELRHDVPAALDELVAAMLRKDPSRRPESAAAVAAALAALGPLGPAGDASEPSPPSRAFSGLTGGEQRVMAMVFVGTVRDLPPAGLEAGDAERIEESEERAQVAMDRLEATNPGLAAPAPMGETPKPPAQPAPLAPTPPGPPAGEGVAAKRPRDPVRVLAREHGGQLDRLADGTSVVTLAGTSLVTDQAARAARFALALRAELPGVPMALATGRGDVTRRIPVGDAIERAARLLGRRAEAAMTAARAGRKPPAAIAVDDITARLLGARFQIITDEGGLSLEGMRELELGARTLLGRSTPMVGREWELSSIETLFFRCVEEPRARPVLVTAAAGMGKSRLGYEVVRALRRRVPNLEVWTGRGDALRAGSALGLLGDVIRSACGIQEGEALDVRRRHLIDRLTGCVSDKMAEFLGEIVDAPFPDETSVGLRAARQDARIMSDQLRAAWEALLASECATHPVLVVLEDLHWADAPTVRFIEATLRSLERRPWMVLALARPQVHARFPRLWAERNVQEIRLKPLSRRAAERLTRQVLGDAVSPETVEHLVTQAEGNAFYLEELIRAVAEDAQGGPLPETVLAMVQARLESLDAESRRMLRAASVFGEVFWPGGVAALLGEAPPSGWDRLVARELVAARPEGRFAGERELAFRHALLREGAYATLTEADRTLGHRLAGEWLEAHGESDAMVLAQHSDLAGVAGRAGAFYVAAAGQALRGADPDAAVSRAERALACGAAGALRCEALGLLCEAHAWRNDWARCAERAAEVMALAPPGSAPWLQACALQQAGAFLTGQPGEALAALAALADVEPAPDAAGSAVPSLALGVFILCIAAEFAHARRVLARLDAAAARAGDLPPVARGWGSLAHAFHAAWGDGDPWAALALARAAERSFIEAGDTRRARFARLFVALTLRSLGMLDDAERELSALPVAASDHLITVFRAFYLTLVLIDRGALDAARALAEARLTQGISRQRASDDRRQAETHWLRGEIAARAGDLDEAERELAAGLEILRLVPLEWQAAAARLAAVRLAAGRVEEALALAREVRGALRTQGGHGPRGTFIRLVYAEALAAAGEHEAARAELAEARDDVQARAARIEDERVKRAFVEGVVENARVIALANSWLEKPK